MTFTVTRLDKTADLLALEDEWLALHQQSQADGIFMTFPWVKHWWQHYGADSKLQLLTARSSEGELLGIAPLMIRQHNPKWGLSWRQLEFISSAHHHEHFDFMILHGHEETVRQAFMKEILESIDGWDVCYFSGLVEGSSVLTEIEASKEDWQPYNGEEIIAPYLTLPETTENWLMMLSSSRRQKQRRFMRKLDEQHNWRFDYIRDEAQIIPIFKRMVALHQAKWEADGMLGAFNDPAMVAFYQDVLPAMYKQGFLRLYCMWIDDKPANIMLGYHFRQRTYYYNSGWDSDLTDLPLGHLMTQLVIDDAIASGDTEYSFMWGTESYKYSFGAVDRVHHRHELIRNARVRVQQQGVSFLRRGKNIVSGIADDTED